MKNRLLPILFVLGGYSAYSQVGIGVGDKTKPNPSSMLDINATNDDGKDEDIRGILIPRVKLSSSTDAKTITKGNVNSLLVFNTETISDITPGYYYWYVDKWHRMVTSDEVAGGLNVADGNGIPADKGQPDYPGAGVTFYTDNTTGAIYMQNTDGTWTQLSGKAGTAGAAGIDGVPGVDGKVPAGVSLVVDEKTGIVYILTPGADPAKPESWIPINGKSGNNGKDGISGGNGVPGAAGTAGIDGEIQMYVDYKTNIVYVRDPQDNTKWIPLSGKAGTAGAAGIDGIPGIDGKVPDGVSLVVDEKTGIVYILTPGADPAKPESWIPINGKNGNNGKDGIVGGEGAPGTTGAAGINSDSTIYIDTKTGTVYILTPGTDPLDPNNWVPITGENGIAGIPGVPGAPGTDGAITTLDAIVKDPNGNIYAYVGADNTVAGRAKEWKDKSSNWVKINGLDGANGIAGATGEPGTAGSITTLDAIIKSPSGDIYAYVGTDKTVDGRAKEWEDESPSWVKINGLNGKDGVSGINGIEGIPGTSGVDIPAGATIVIDKTTGTVYVLVPNGDPTKPEDWKSINGTNGIAGIPGVPGAPGTDGAITTLDAIVKDPNGNIYAYVGADNTVAGRAKEWKDKSSNWVKINGLDGANGIAGATGEPGTAGSITTLDAIIKSPSGDIYAYVGTDKTVDGRAKEWEDESPSWVKINGLNGKDGVSGINGIEGIPGTSGVDIPAGATIVIDKTTGTVYVLVPNGDPTKPEDWKSINGTNGIAGIPGVPGAPGTDGAITTLDAIVKDPNGNIYAYVGADNTVAGRAKEWKDKSSNWVKINGLDGANGIAGATGEPGTAGSITTLDAIIKSPSGDIYAYVGTDKTVDGRAKEWEDESPSWVKINGLNGKDGVSGINGIEGIPGTSGVDIPAGATIVIDKTTGTVYVLVPNGDPTKPEDWKSINGTNGIAGIPGVPGAPGTDGAITTLDAIVKDPNGNIYAYVGADNTVAGRAKEWKDKSSNWVKINGLDGANGIAGATGEPGTAGSITTLDAIIKSPSGDIYAYVGTDKTVDGRAKEWEDESPSWVKINGLNGKDGVSGINGIEGIPGTSGVDIPAGATIVIDKTTGTVYVLVPNGDPTKPEDWKSINGTNGIAGIPGVPGAPGTDGAITTLDAIVKDPNGNIYAYVGADNTVAGRAKEWKDKSSNWVKINGLDGANGIAGATGEPGTAGSITTLDAIIKSPSGDIYAYVGTDKTVDGRAKEWEDESPSWVKINGLNGKDGVSGINGIEGIPGTSGVDIPAGATIVIDKTTGTVYVLVPNGDPTKPEDWKSINGTNGIAGIPGVPGAPGTDGAITTLDAIVKDPNGNIYAYVGADNTVAGRAKEWKDKSSNWVKINGLDGANGIAGATGEPGTAGSITTLDAIIKSPSGDIYAYVGTDKTVDGRAKEWEDESPSWVKINGLNGKDGVSGINGIEGIPGTSGVDIPAGATIVIDKTTGTVYVLVPNGDPTKPEDWKSINGTNGIAGIPGVPGAPGTDGAITTLDAIVKDPNGNIYAYVGADNTVAGRAKEWKDKSSNWVKINGLDGANGIAGATGEPGTAGSITTLDAIIKSPSGDIYAYVGTDKTVDGRAKEWEDESPSWVKINGLNGKDGVSGINGIEGIPGTSGVDIPAGATIVIDKTTGTVYVLVPNGDPTKPEDWKSINGTNGIAGIPGVPGAPGTDGAITTLDAIVKDPNGNIYAYVGADNTVAGRAKEWKDKSSNWVKINGLDGANGIAGATGEPGTAGSITTLDAIIKSPSGDIYAYVGTDKTVDGRAKEWEDESPSWVKINGLNGKDGVSGINGIEGIPGTSGVDIPAGATIVIDKTTGTVYVLVPNGDPTKPEDWKSINGTNGIAGIPGVPGAPGTDGAITTLDAIVKDPNGNIYAYVGADNTVAGRAKEWKDKSSNWVKINGLDGANGIAGATGEPGTAGSITTLDAIIKSPSGDIYAYVGTDKTVDGRAKEWEDESPSWVKINGLNGKDGVSGINGIEGIPGTSGVDIPAGATIVIDKTTGTVYVLVPNGDPTKPEDWKSINGTNGIAGIPGVPGAPGTDGAITTLDAIVKDPNGNIYAYVGADNTVAGRAKEWKDKSSNWVKINGLDGANGIAGATGEPGTAGSITTLDAIIKSPSGDIYAYVGTDKTVDGRAKEWEDESPSWVKINGLNGKDGVSGINGIEGIPGTSGVDIPAGATIVIDKTTGTVYVLVPNGDPTKPEDWKSINGTNGIAGIPGVPGAPGTDGAITTLDAIVKDPNGNIYAYVGADNTVAGRAKEWKDKSSNWVKINGLDGANGIAGATGEPGTAGSITTLDAIIKSPSGDIYAYVGTDKTVDGRAKEWEDESPSWVKINGLNGKDGVSGINGIEGIPGTSGVDIPAGATIVIDKTTGTVYVLVPNGDPTKPEDWKSINGTNGIAGIPGVPGAPGTDGAITTLDAIVKDPNGNIYAYVGADNTVAGRAKEWKDKSSNWVKINGLDGANGIAGATGEPGTAGSITTLDAIIKSPSGDIYAYVGTDKTVDGRAKEWENESPSWVKINGLNGTNGVAGVSGVPGTAGVDIPSGATIVIDNTGTIYVLKPNGDPTIPADWTPVKGNETLTTLTNNSDGTYTYKNEAGTEVKIDVVGDVTSNFSTIVNTPAVTNIIQQIAGNVEGNVTYDSTLNEFSYTDASGVEHVINLSDAVKANETVTTLTDNTDGSYTYKNEAGTEVKIDVVGDVTSNFSTIVNTPAVTNIIQQIAGNVEGNVTYDSTLNEFRYTDASGVEHVINLSDAVKANETVTTLTDNTDGSYTYKNEAGTEVKIDVVGDVTSNFSTIVNTPAVTNIIQQIAGNVEGNVTYNSTLKEFNYTDASGVEHVINLSDAVKANETLTGLVYNRASKSLVYTDENLFATTINLATLVTDTETQTTLDYDATAKTLIYNGESGTPTEINLSDLVNNTISKDDFTTKTPATVLSVTGDGATLAAASVDIVPSKVVGEVLATISEGVVGWQTIAKPNVMKINLTKESYTVKDDDYTVIARNLENDITITLPDATKCEGRMLVINQFNMFKADGITPVQVNFDVKVKYSDTQEYSYIATSVSGGLTSGSAKVTLQSDGTNWYVITYTM